MQPTTIRTYMLVDLKCYMCGATAGSIEREQGNATPRVALERAGNVGMIDAQGLPIPQRAGAPYRPHTGWLLEMLIAATANVPTPTLFS